MQKADAAKRYDDRQHEDKPLAATMAVLAFLFVAAWTDGSVDRAATRSRRFRRLDAFREHCAIRAVSGRISAHAHFRSKGA